MEMLILESMRPYFGTHTPSPLSLRASMVCSTASVIPLTVPCVSSSRFSRMNPDSGQKSCFICKRTFLTIPKLGS